MYQRFSPTDIITPIMKLTYTYLPTGEKVVKKFSCAKACAKFHASLQLYPSTFSDIEISFVGGFNLEGFEHREPKPQIGEWLTMEQKMHYYYSQFDF